jgi:hypothetical protein
MDSLSYPHCVWTNGTTVKYARFYGQEWCIAGGTAVAYTSSETISLSKNCIGIGENGNCFFALLDGQDIKLCSWDGLQWNIETVWAGANSNDVLAFAVTWVEYPVVTIFTKNYGNRSVWVVDKQTGTWSSPARIVVPPQDNDQVELKAIKVNNLVYLFWTGKSLSSGTSWIGHTIWNAASRTWLSLAEKKVLMSEAEGDIAGMDFVVGYEGETSSSESSSSS